MPYADIEKRRAVSRKHRLNNLEYYKNYNARYRRENPEVYLWVACHKRAKDNSIPFDITRADIIIPEFCPVLSIKLERGHKGFHEAAPSIDRIDATKGYVKGNIAVISFRANRLKSNATLQELRALVAWLEKVQPEPVPQLTASAAS